MNKPQPASQPLPFHGCDRGMSCSPETPCFVRHPWSFSGETCLYASAYMRADHVESEKTRSLSGEVTYSEALEAKMKADLLNHE